MFLSKRRNGFYYLYFYDNSGQRNVISTKQKKKNLALQFLNSFKLNDQQINKTNFTTFKNDYLKQSEAVHSFKTTKYVQTVLNSLSDHIGKKDLSSITQNDIENYLQIKLNTSHYTAQKHLAHLKAFFNKAVDKDLIKVNPCNKIKNFKLPQKQPVYFTHESFIKFLGFVDDQDLKDLFVFAVNTGMRQMEILTLCCNQLDFKSRQIILDNNTHVTKSKKVRSIPMNETVYNILLRRNQGQESIFVFTYHNEPIKPDFISKKFKKIVRKAGLDDRLKFHSCRHSFASWLVQKNVSVYQVSKLLGHADIKTTQIYSHLKPEDLTNAVNKLEVNQ